MKRILYIYPMTKRVSFTVVAGTYIDALRRLGYEVHELDMNVPIPPDEEYDVCVMHPVLYSMLKYPRTFRRLLQRCREWIGFDVCDTNHITPHAAYVLSLFERIAVPSRFCADVFRVSGVTSDIYVVPHHLDDVFLRDDIDVKSPIIDEVRSIDKPKFLFFLWHSWFRKGADVVAYAWKEVSKEIDAVLIVKAALHPDPMLGIFEGLDNVIIIDEWMSREEMVALYDAVDVVLVPSRGGGFELNALEALARGKIVVTSEWYPIQEYCYECIKVKTSAWVRIFDPSTMEGLTHDGYGVDPSVDDMIEKIRLVYHNLDNLKPIFEKAKHRVRKEYSFDAIRDKLIDFVEGRKRG